MATVQQARVGIFEVLETACVCTGMVGDGDSNCKYHARQMSFYSSVSGFLK